MKPDELFAIAKPLGMSTRKCQRILVVANQTTKTEQGRDHKFFELLRYGTPEPVRQRIEEVLQKLDSSQPTIDTPVLPASIVQEEQITPGQNQPRLGRGGDWKVVRVSTISGRQ